jgi:hypothetical protein
VFAAKLYGTLVLDQAFRDTPLEFMVLFSSNSAFVAPVGQIDYVAANSFLNAFAESCWSRRKYTEPDLRRRSDGIATRYVEERQRRRWLRAAEPSGKSRGTNPDRVPRVHRR